MEWPKHTALSSNFCMMLFRQPNFIQKVPPKVAPKVVVPYMGSEKVESTFGTFGHVLRKISTFGGKNELLESVYLDPQNR